MMHGLNVSGLIILVIMRMMYDCVTGKQVPHMVNTNKNDLLLEFYSDLSLPIIGQDPLIPADSEERQIPSQDSPTFPRLPSGSQAIITTYSFRACGRIIGWHTYIRPGGRYTIRFQVWRQESDTVYNLVGENEYLNFLVREEIPVIGTVSSAPDTPDFILVQPGDVLGYFVSFGDNDSDSEDDNTNEGILLDTSFRDEIILYHTFDDSDEDDEINRPTPSRVTVGILDSTTRAGPVISPDVGECCMRGLAKPFLLGDLQCMSWAGPVNFSLLWVSTAYEGSPNCFSMRLHEGIPIGTHKHMCNSMTIL